MEVGFRDTRTPPSPPYEQITVRTYPGIWSEEYSWAVVIEFNYLLCNFPYEIGFRQDRML